MQYSKCIMQYIDSQENSGNRVLIKIHDFILFNNKCTLLSMDVTFPSHLAIALAVQAEYDIPPPRQSVMGFNLVGLSARW
jgi:hypothetical protein